MDGAQLTTDVTTCYTLALADCSAQSQFAVFIRKVEGIATPLVQSTPFNYLTIIFLMPLLHCFTYKNYVSTCAAKLAHPIPSRC
jgi:hypothetical protein